MFKTWSYSEKDSTKAIKQKQQEAANARIGVYASHDPEMPWYGRDPKEIKRDPRWQQLSRQHKDLFNRFTDELWINKGFLPDNMELIADCLEVSPEEAQAFLDACLQLGITKHERGRRILIPELREQYVRAVLKSEKKAEAGRTSQQSRKNKDSVDDLDTPF